jgi:hypothetical protein
MVGSRRHLLLTACAAVGTCFLRAKSTFAQTASAQQPKPPGPPGDLEDPESPRVPASATKALLEQRQKGIKKDVDKLFELATELKAAVEKTDSTAVLSLVMIKKAEEIEKLAHQIKGHAKG